MMVRMKRVMKNVMWMLSIVVIVVVWSVGFVVMKRSVIRDVRQFLFILYVVRIMVSLMRVNVIIFGIFQVIGLFLRRSMESIMMFFFMNGCFVLRQFCMFFLLGYLNLGIILQFLFGRFDFNFWRKFLQFLVGIL